ncbi:pyridoxal-phosphate dependent enzyme [Virgibacillus pantothenticus]|uniref:pyridoxal-phosphate dependent enzyme n=1 Tax=Virgibacillus pantothenticus TaxID=1473 RepID=UPI001C2446C8|nr:pyridoxal-phosphate dependent enzyme [Virgibacillus pantothenticus]MBU8567940.1 pyridoxal-phosphate dependent enzyme [Virgibacillus pantothenticus]MBU8601803.1 pyridoxal-phosphate dependent enzyme [Virgibacillus pantothenticus]MBU8635957.1 pyridoxal-phosphate dependent enzyme [Virgibacillus pantothenticus]MBU8643641.1 pyridoxal-phosphate dependent enzyme [Virgibacillus pantothenticus]MBU8647781.1 pyridoxal-phosphate dependent enzyme [Virgibacillus pantothenticus]
MIKNYLNINSYFNYELFDQITKELITKENLLSVMPKSLAQLEISMDRLIEIPEEVQQVYSQYRMTPLFRAENFEKAIKTDCEIYIKDEGTTLSGNHKANSATLISYLCKKDGVKTITTETTGNWGSALAIAAKDFGIEVICFIDEESNALRPDRKSEMERAGAKVIVVPLAKDYEDLLTLSANAAIQYTKELDDAVYIFGSVYGYFVIPQTIIGLEAKEQLAALNRYPDVVVGSCGGGANILGTASAFIADKLDLRKDVEVFSAEADSCPILSSGVWGHYTIDSQNYYPLIHTYGLDGIINDGKYIGGLGSTIVAPAVAHFHSQGIIKSKTFSAEEAKQAAEIFRDSEGIFVALETGYQLAAVMDKAKQLSQKVILVNISSGVNDKQFYEK